MAWRIFLGMGMLATIGFFLAPTGGLLQRGIPVALNGAAATALWLGVRRQRPRPRGAWRVLLAAAAVYFAGVVIWNLSPAVSGRPLPFPSVSDPLFWVSYLGWLVFLMAVIRRHSHGHRGAVLDVMIVAAGVSVLGWEVLLRPILGLAGLAPVVRFSGLAYPVLLTLVVAAALRAAVAPERRTTVHALMVGWIGLELAVDLWYSLASANGTFRYGHPWFAAWLLSYALLGALGLHPRLAWLTAPPGSRQVVTHRARLAMLGVAGFLPLAAIAHDSLDRPDRLALLGVATVILVAMVLRLGQSTHDLAEKQHQHAAEQQLRSELEHAVLHDRLTGLANRVGFEQALRRALAVRHEPDHAAMVLLGDLDGFKAVNDTYGHEAGDELLRQIAARLAAQVRDADTVARLGGDEFAVVVDDIHLADGLALANRIAAAVVAPIDIGPATPAVAMSVGVYRTEPGDGSDEALRHADAAMYSAKAAGGGVQLFDAARHRRFLDRYRLELRLRAAADAGELVLHYQPVVRLDGRTTVAAEALLRWQHPERGWLLPGEFIELAETSGAIIEIGRWVLRQACRDAASWQRDGGGGCGVAVNVSRRQLSSPTIVEDVAGALAASGLPPGQLTLEVTETSMAEDIDEMIEVLHELKALGVDLAMDDFGTGYSSLTDLQRMPVDVLKIDRAFVAGIARSEAEWALTSAIVRLATSLDKRTLAEGIEEASQLAHLRSLGCELGQGYLFARPMPVDEFRALLDSELASAP